MGQQIHWFPGHMKKALEEMNKKIKLVDVVIEILDSRAPFSSINDELEKMIVNKKRIIVFSKTDLADPKITELALKIFKEKYSCVLSLDLLNQKSNQILSNEVSKLGIDKHKKEINKGMKPQALKVMIIGIPNVGKSSLINRFAKRKAAGVENKPGFTRGEQWIKVNSDFILLDTPGVLPMNYENKNKAVNLALLGSIREEILPIFDLSDALLNYLKQYYPNALKQRFNISEINENNGVLQYISTKRGLLNKGQPDLEKAARLLLKEFKEGKLGRISLEQF